MKIITAGLLVLFLLAGCQTTSPIPEKKIVSCDTASYEFVTLNHLSQTCFTFLRENFNQYTERLSIFDGGKALLVDLIKYNNTTNFFNDVESLKKSHQFDFGAQFRRGANNSDSQVVIQFLSNMKLNYLERNEDLKQALWLTSTYENGKNYFGYSFIKLLKHNNNYYQLAGYYVENTYLPMKRNNFDHFLNHFKFADKAEPSIKIPVKTEPNNSETLEQRLLKVKSLLNKGLISEKDAQEKRKEILNNL